MTIHHTSTRNITEYHFDLAANTPSPKCPDTLGKVVIFFENGKFFKCFFPFCGIYTREQWAMLAEIENEIHRIELSLLR
jgi:hypothetical protein